MIVNALHYTLTYCWEKSTISESSKLFCNMAIAVLKPFFKLGVV